MSSNNIGIPRQRVPFRGYIFRLMENNGIPNPAGGQTREELWGYFIEEMSKKGGSTIITNLSATGGSLVSELTASLSGNTLTVNKKDTNIDTGVSVDTSLPIIAGQNVVFSGSVPGGVTISVPSIGVQSRFTSTENGSGAVGSVLPLTISATTPFNAGDILAVGSIVYLANNFTVEVTTINTLMDSYDGVVIEVSNTQVQSDWNETNSASDAYILNKPDFTGLSTDVTNITNTLNDIIGQFGDGYFVKELVANVDTTLKTVEIVKTHVPIDPLLPTNIYPFTLQVGSALTLAASVDINGDPVVTIDADLTSPGSPITNIINDITSINTDITNINTNITNIQQDIIDIQGDITNINTDITNIQQDITDLQVDVSNKVDKISGKGLSTEDYTTAEKTKLASIEPGAQVNVQSDWNQTNTAADDYIKNKPTSLSATWGSITGTLSNQTDLQSELDDKVDKVRFGDGYFVKELVANVDTTLKTIEIIKTHQSVNASDPTMVYPLTIEAGSGLSMAASVDINGDPVLTLDVDTTAPGSPITNIVNDITNITNNINDIIGQFGDGYFVKELVANVDDINNEIVVVKTHVSIDPLDPTMVYPLTIKAGTGLDLVASVDGGGHPVVTINSTVSSNVTYWKTVNTPSGIVVGSVVTDDFTDLTKISGPNATPDEQDHIFGVDAAGNSFESLVTGVSGTTVTSQVIIVNVVISTVWGGITGNIMNQPEFTPFGDGYIVKELVANVDISTKSIEIVKTHTSLIPANPTMVYPLTIEAGSGLSMAASVDINGDPVVTIDVDLTSPGSPITNIINDITTIQGDITTINNTLTSHNTAITNIQNDITNINTDITNINTDITNINTDITNIQTDITNLDNRVTTVEGDITTINNTITDITGQFGDGYFVKELVANVDTVNDEIVVIKTHVSINPSDPTMVYPLTLKCGNGLSLATSTDTNGDPVVTINSSAQSANRMSFNGNGTSNTITLPSTINSVGADVFLNGLLLGYSEYTLTNIVFTFSGSWTLDPADDIIIKWYN